VLKDAASGIGESLSTVRNRAARALARVAISATCRSAEFLYLTGDHGKRLLDLYAHTVHNGILKGLK